MIFKNHAKNEAEKAQLPNQLNTKQAPYKLGKFCDQLLKRLTKNEYTIKDSFSFAKEVLAFNASLFIACFDIKSLFGNLTKSCFYNLLKMTMF